ncbi:DUF3152 domain-containing protein [Streptomyces sp. NPDC006516]|uniref:DUF3152 domain-containing protein n=1 Tax=Streptomyces sp. NPDC006516 TaxID=3154309 RepID=UPI0033AC0AD6
MHQDTRRTRTTTGSRTRGGSPAQGPRGSRAHDRGRPLARRRQLRRRRAGVGAAVTAVAALVAFLHAAPWQDEDAAVAAGRAAPETTASPATPDSPTAPGSPEASGPASASPEATTPTGTPPGKRKPTDPASVPQSGPGTFTVAREGASSGGSGSRYRVEVEDGIGVDPDGAAADIAEILADPRGWSKGGGRKFRQVADGSAGLVIRIGTPRTTDRLCGQYGLDTGGEVNCRGGENVMVNLARWQLGSPTFDGPPSEYRALIINHEVGHWLGHGHETCPGPGRPAPAMMQQIKGLKGCVSNAWPYDGNGRYLGGPSVR